MASRHAEQVMMTERCYVVCHPVDRALVNEFPANYQAKSLVIASDLDEVFAVTNDMEASRRLARTVVPLGCDSYRSTSVGDVVIESTQRVFLCNNRGWTPVKGSCSVLPFCWTADNWLVGLFKTLSNKDQRGAQ